MLSYSYGDFVWPFGGFFNFIVVLLVVGLVVALCRPSKRPTEGGKTQDEAMQILRKRYASGEINAEEFAQKKKDLES